MDTANISPFISQMNTLISDGDEPGIRRVLLANSDRLRTFALISTDYEQAQQLNAIGGQLLGMDRELGTIVKACAEAVISRISSDILRAKQHIRSCIQRPLMVVLADTRVPASVQQDLFSLMRKLNETHMEAEPYAKNQERELPTMDSLIEDHLKIVDTLRSNPQAYDAFRERVAEVYGQAS